MAGFVYCRIRHRLPLNRVLLRTGPRTDMGTKPMNAEDRQVVKNTLEVLYQAELEADGYAEVLIRNGRQTLQDRI